MNLHRNIRALRKEKGLTLDQVGQAFEIKRSSVAGWESGDTRPDLDKLVKLANLFGVTVDFLLTGDATKGTTKRQRVEWPFHFSVSDYNALPPELQGRVEGFVGGVIAEWQSRPENRRAV